MMVRLRYIEDIDQLMSWRSEVIYYVFGVRPGEALLRSNREYYRRHVAAGEHLAIVASRGDEDCGCGALCFTEELPSPDNPSGKCAYLMNIYVRPAFRNNGIAHIIVRRLIEEARNRNCGKIYLETTAEGKPVYTSLGFRQMADMMKYYDDKD